MDAALHDLGQIPITEFGEAGREGMDRLWENAQLFLSAAGVVSKLLWEGDRAKLRSSLGVPAESPLKARTLRDAFEHIDEKLVDWAKKNPDLPPADDLSVLGSDVTSEGFFRYFDPDHRRIVWQGTPYDIDPMVAGLREINKRAEQAVPFPW